MLLHGVWWYDHCLPIDEILGIEEIPRWEWRNENRRNQIENRREHDKRRGERRGELCEGIPTGGGANLDRDSRARIYEDVHRRRNISIVLDPACAVILINYWMINPKIVFFVFLRYISSQNVRGMNSLLLLLVLSPSHSFLVYKMRKSFIIAINENELKNGFLDLWIEVYYDVLWNVHVDKSFPFLID